MIKKMSLFTAVMFTLMTLLAVIAVAAPTGISYDYSTGKFKGVTTGMEYSTNSGTSWTTVPSAGLSGVPGTTYLFRNKNETDTVSISVTASGDAPTTPAYANGKITGLTSAMEYNKISATNSTWTKCTGTELSVTLSQSAQTYYFRFAATSTTSPSAVKSVTVPASSVSDASGITKDFANEVFTGFGTNGGGWFYTTVSATYTGTFLYAVTASTTSMLPDSTYYFRKSGDSSGTAFTTPKRPAAPSGIGYDAATGKLTGVTSAMRFGVKPPAFAIVWQDGSNPTFAQTDAEQIVYVAYKATDTNFASMNTTIKIWPKLGDAAFNSVRYAGGKILGVTADMEYKVGDTETWTVCPADELSIARTTSDQTVTIRLKAEIDKSIAIVVPFQLPKPEVTLDLVNGIITGLDPNLNYMYKTTGWKSITGTLISEDKTTFKISSLLKGAALDLKIAIKPASGNPEDDSATTIAIGAAPTKPVLAVKTYTAPDSGTGFAEIDVKDVSGLQFKLENDPSWSAPTTDGNNIELPVGYTAATYIFRVAPKQTDTEVVQGSAEVKVKIAAPAKQPTVKVDYKKELITVKAKSSYSLDGVEWIETSENKVFKLAEHGLYGGTIFVRVAPTAKKPASDVATIKINPRMANPPSNADVFIGDVKGKTKVIMRSGARTMEYMSGGKWKKGVPAYAEALNVEIRFMADLNFGPSESVYITKDGIG